MSSGAWWYKVEKSGQTVCLEYKNDGVTTGDVTITTWVKLQRFERHLLNVIAKNLRLAKLPPLTWHDVLWELEKAPGSKLHPSQIEELILLSQYNVSRLIDRLVSRGYVTRETCGGDKRRQWIIITEQGRQLRQKIWPVYIRSMEQHFAQLLSVHEKKQLATIIDKLLSFSRK